ncbi:MAG: hypothetical protein LUE25_02135 [Clostridiales bacterium]|nr:hypothetical protein [Clostridiales bacterium]
MKKIFILILAIAMCFSVVSCADSIDAEDVKSADTNALESEAESDTEATDTVNEDTNLITETEETAETSYYVTVCPGSIFPNAWRSMNAMIVTFGETDPSWSYDYMSVGVENVEILSATMSESTLFNEESEVEYPYEEGASNINHLIFTEEYLDDIVEGETALVFTGGTQSYYYENDDGEWVYENCINISFSIIPIVDGKLVLPDDFSETLTYYFTEGNTFMEKNYPDVDIRFEDGMTVEEFGEFVEYLCTEADGLIYP